MECVSNAKVRQDRLQLPRYGEVMVSTIFMGLDHNESGRGNPVLWETAVLGMPNDMTRKFSSREEALRYHDELLQVLPAAYLPVTFRPASSPIEHALLN